MRIFYNLLTILTVFSVVCIPVSGQDTKVRIDIPADVLMDFVDDMTLPHEDVPAGVPESYDWAKKPRAGKWNSPGDKFKAITGWAQVFPVKHEQPHEVGKVIISELRTFVLSKTTGQWLKVQDGIIQGSLYRADYVNNITSPANIKIDKNVVTVKVPLGSAFHFWPKSGKSRLNPDDVGAVLVTVKARVEMRENTSSYLLGLGADYWVDTKASWDHYKTNQGVAVGRLKRVTTQWQWFGMTTATKKQLEVLRVNGYQTVFNLQQ